MPTSSPVAVVTGAARGIGKQIALDLLLRGYRVVIGDLDLEATQATATELGAGASAVRLDITDRELLTEVVATVEAEVGPIQLWVNNAGIMPTGAFSQQPAEVAAAIIRINYGGLVEATKAVLPRMLARGSGTIVNMASATGIKPLAGLAVYSGTKAAVIAFSDSLRRELRGTGVRIHVIAPNLVRTALGAGITPPKLSGSINAQSVSTAVMRVLDRSKFLVAVPGYLGPILKLSKLLPVAFQDWADDRIGTDSIGLGGDPTVRAAYLNDVIEKNDTAASQP
jgi:short-subunit dehydrogenase